MKFIIPNLIVVFFAVNLLAQYPVSSGDELGLRPIESVDGIDILGRFYEVEDIDKRGCWVHHHPNGSDFVVTPKTWRAAPNDTRKKIIYEAMEVITDARETYGRFGSLSTNLYYILDDTLHSSLGEAFWIVNKSCWMRSGVPQISRTSAGNRQQIYAHEIGHCLIMENLDNYTTNFNLNQWFDESVAEYLGSEVYPSNNREHGHSRRFAFSESFRKRYDAYHLWKYYVDREGHNMLFPMMQSLANLSSINARRDYMQRSGFDAILHDFYFDSYRERQMDSDGSSIIPVNTSTLKAPVVNLNPDLNRLNIESLPMDKLNGFYLIIPKGYDLDINPLAGGGATFYQSLLEGENFHIRNWSTKKTVKGDCENEVSFLVLSSHMNNKPLTGLYFDYALIKKEEEDCCDEAIAGDCNDCLAPLDVESEMPPNPVDKINSAFKFDYKIESAVKFQMDMSDVNIEYFRGDPNQLEMNYYVNSADGSILFPGGPQGFFKTNFSYRSHFKKVDAAIWLANGQMVIYGYGRDGQKRAVTRETTQTANDRFGSDYLSMMQFFSSSEELAVHPEPMPEHIKWNNITKGYTGKLIEGHTGIENTWTLYFDTAPTPIKTSCIMMGFMVGVLKDVREQQCNSLVVYNKVNIGGEDSGEAIEAELRSIKPLGIAFDGTGYKPMLIGGDAGTDIQAKQRRFQGQMVRILRRKETLKENRKRCSLNLCRDNIDRELEQLQEEEDRLNCEMARAMGLDDLMEECN